jgi:two-component system CheB/CheR fusion protein
MGDNTKRREAAGPLSMAAASAALDSGQAQGALSSSAQVVRVDGAQGARPWVLALGASAGGLEALRQVVPSLPLRPDLCVVVAQHTSADHRSLLSELLARETLVPVRDMIEGDRLLPGGVQVVPSGMHARLEQGRWRLVPAAGTPGPKPSIDLLFESLAQDAGERLLAAVLSGTGSDGSRGLRAVRAAGGCTFAQDPATARHAGMPRHAVDAGLVDFIVAPLQLVPAALGVVDGAAARPPGRILGCDTADTGGDGDGDGDGDDAAQWEAAARLVGAGTGFDLRAYRATSVRRRAKRRMRVRGCDTTAAYVRLLAAEPDEQRRLVDEMLISVTGFFRDADVFAALPAVLEPLLQGTTLAELRVWVAGCASGEEAYSLALLLADARQRLQLSLPVRIFATDIDAEALAVARRGQYPLAALADVPEPLRGLLEIEGEGFRVAKAVRDMVLFSQHDVLRDPPFMHQALVSCRNLLIYFTPEYQQRALRQFCAALDVGGLLLLGRTEAPPQGLGLETCADAAAQGAGGLRNLYRLMHRTPWRAPALAAPTAARTEPPRVAAAPPAAGRLPAAAQALLAAHELGMLGALAMVGPQGQLEHVFGDVRRWLQLGAGGVSLDAVQLALPGLRLDLRVLLRRAAQQRGQRTSVVADPGSGERRVRITALAPADSPTTLLAFEPLEDLPSADTPVGPDEQVLALQGHLQATREHLQSLVSELDAANEQLQVLNEELQASNEELQASNEELETSNEELQSTNEELVTVNQELESRSAELAQTNTDLRNVMVSLADPLIVVDEHLRLLQRNPASELLFAATTRLDGVPPEGAPAPLQQLFAMPWQVPTEGIAGATRMLLAGGTPAPLAVAAPDGRRWQLRVQPYLLADGRHRGAVLAFTETTAADRLADELRGAAQRLELSESFRRATVDALADELCVIDHDGRIVQTNGAWHRGIDQAGATGARDADVGGSYIAACERSAAAGDVLAAEFLAGLLAVRAGTQRQFRQEYPCETPSGLRWYRVTVTAFADGRPFLVLLHQDITALRQQLERIELNARALDSALNGIVICDASTPQLPIVYVNRAFVDITGYTEAEALGRSCNFLQGSDRGQSGVIRLRKAIAQRQNCQVLLRNYRRDGSAFWNELTLSMVRDARGRLTHMVGVQRDVTAMIASEEALKAAQRREAQALAFAGVGTLGWRLRDGLVSLSRQHARLLTLDERLQLPWEELRRRVHPDDLPAFDDAVKLCVAGHTPLDIEWRCRTEDGWRWLRTQGDVERDDDGTAMDLVAISQDIGARRAAEERAAHMAQHDALTGLPNRSLLRDRLLVAIRGASRSRARLALLFIDLDRFKEVNDSLGHEVGDELLRGVAHRLKACVRESDTVSRLGGDEFVLLLPGVAQADEARQVADKLMEAVARPFELDGNTVMVGASVGVAIYPEDGIDADTLMRHADAAMYRAKGAGRDTVRFFSQQEDDTAQRALTQRAALREGLHAGELQLFFQPQVACDDGRLLGLEALLRWRHPADGLLAPDAFLPLAEDTPLIDEIGRWVLEQACAQAVRWRGTPLGGVPVAVNVSPHQLRNGSFLRTLSAALGATGAAPTEIEIELTERAILHNDESSRAVLADIHAMGVALALDDFGTGYSSLSHLYQTPLRRIKIDRSFCSALPGDRNAEAIVGAVVQMARSIGLTVIAEGVETPEQLAHLLGAGCDGVQGYLVLKPMPPDLLAQALAQRRAELGWPKDPRNRSGRSPEPDSITGNARSS